MDESFKELPDHIAVELEFIYFLTYERVNALEKSESDRARSLQEARNVFLNTYLGKWAPVFCDKIITNTITPFILPWLTVYLPFSHNLPDMDYWALCGRKQCDLSMS